MAAGGSKSMSSVHQKRGEARANLNGGESVPKTAAPWTVTNCEPQRRAFFFFGSAVRARSSDGHQYILF